MDGFHLYIFKDSLKTWRLLLGEEHYIEQFEAREQALDKEAELLHSKYTELIENAKIDFAIKKETG